MASADRNAKLSVYSCPPFCDLIQSSELHIQSGLVGRMEAVNQGLVIDIFQCSIWSDIDFKPGLTGLTGF